MNAQQFDQGKRAQARQKLASDLAGLASETLFIPNEETEMLSFIVDEATKGVDIETRYPEFYRKLLGNAALRQVFLDTLGMLEAGKAGELLPLPAGEEPRLEFLTKKAPQPAPASSQGWKITLQKSIQELKSIFSPPQLAYRTETNFFEDNWFTILRDEIALAGSNYSILLECGLSKETEDALSATLNIAISLEKLPSAPAFPIHATLRWGKYSETLILPDEGRVRFPDISFAATFDPQNQEITSGLDLVLENSPA